MAALPNQPQQPTTSDESLQAMFTRYDTNNDGFLSFAEMTTFFTDYHINDPEQQHALFYLMLVTPQTQTNTNLYAPAITFNLFKLLLNPIAEERLLSFYHFLANKNDLEQLVQAFRLFNNLNVSKTGFVSYNDFIVAVSMLGAKYTKLEINAALVKSVDSQHFFTFRQYYCKITRDKEQNSKQIVSNISSSAWSSVCNSVCTSSSDEYTCTPELFLSDNNSENSENNSEKRGNSVDSVDSVDTVNVNSVNGVNRESVGVIGEQRKQSARIVQNNTKNSANNGNYSVSSNDENRDTVCTVGRKEEGSGSERASRVAIGEFSKRHPKFWNARDVEQWGEQLRELIKKVVNNDINLIRGNSDDYVALLKEFEVDGEILAHLTDQSLFKIGILVARTREFILFCIKGLFEQYGINVSQHRNRFTNTKCNENDTYFCYSPGTDVRAFMESDKISQ